MRLSTPASMRTSCGRVLLADALCSFSPISSRLSTPRLNGRHSVSPRRRRHLPGDLSTAPAGRRGGPCRAAGNGVGTTGAGWGCCRGQGLRRSAGTAPGGTAREGGSGRHAEGCGHFWGAITRAGWGRRNRSGQVPLTCPVLLSRPPLAPAGVRDGLADHAVALEAHGLDPPVCLVEVPARRHARRQRPAGLAVVVRQLVRVLVENSSRSPNSTRSHRARAAVNSFCTCPCQATTSF